MVHFDFTQSVSWATGRTVVPSAEEVAVGPPCGSTTGEDRLKVRHTCVEVGNGLDSGPFGSVVDLAATLFLTARILRNIISAKRARQAARVCVSVASEMGQEMTDGPTGKTAR